MSETKPNPTMLYKHPGCHEIHGDKFDYVTIDENSTEFDVALEDGWCRTTTEAKNQDDQDDQDDQPTREELEMKAKELDIDFDGRTSDNKLADRIAEVLEA